MNKEYARIKREVNNLTCRYCAYHKNNKCANERSDNYGDYTYATESCPDFEGEEADGFVTIWRQ